MTDAGTTPCSEITQDKQQVPFKKHKPCQEEGEQQEQEDEQEDYEHCWEVEQDQKDEEVKKTMEDRAERTYQKMQSDMHTKWSAKIRTCSRHDDHCAVCGIGARSRDDLNNIEVQYTWREIQNVAYQEIDHARCNECYKLMARVPRNYSQWDKEPVLTFLHLIRTHAYETEIRHECK